MAFSTVARVGPGIVVAGAAAYLANQQVEKLVKKDGLDLNNPGVKCINAATVGGAAGIAYTPFWVHRKLASELAQDNVGKSFKANSREAAKIMLEHPAGSLRAISHVLPGTTVRPYLFCGGIAVANEVAKAAFKKASKPA